MKRPDDFTATVDGAAAFERGRVLDTYDPSDVEMTRGEAEREAARDYFDSVNATLSARPGQVRKPKAGPQEVAA